MSTPHKSRAPSLYELSTFWGVANRGVCLQITQTRGYIQICDADVHALIMDLLDYEADALEEDV